MPPSHALWAVKPLSWLGADRVNHHTLRTRLRPGLGSRLDLDETSHDRDRHTLHYGQDQGVKTPTTTWCVGVKDQSVRAKPPVHAATIKFLLLLTLPPGGLCPLALVLLLPLPSPTDLAASFWSNQYSVLILIRGDCGGVSGLGV